MNTQYHQLTVAALNAAQQKDTCGPYKYVVQHSFLPHTAFETRSGLERWLKERNLTVLEIPRPTEPGDWHNPRRNWCDIKGSYSTRMHWDKETFYALEHVAVRGKTLSNGDWVEAIITNENALDWCVHTLNPNVRDRITFDYQSTREEMK